MCPKWDSNPQGHYNLRILSPLPRPVRLFGLFFDFAAILFLKNVWLTYTPPGMSVNNQEQHTTKIVGI